MITLKLDQNELQALAGLLDLGVKSAGLSAVKTAASLLEKLEAAVAEANAKPEPQEKPDAA
jgi:hypothetical protein